MVIAKDSGMSVETRNKAEKRREREGRKEVPYGDGRMASTSPSGLFVLCVVNGVTAVEEDA